MLFVRGEGEEDFRRRACELVSTFASERERNSLPLGEINRNEKKAPARLLASFLDKQRDHLDAAVAVAETNLRRGERWLGAIRELCVGDRKQIPPFPDPKPKKTAPLRTARDKKSSQKLASAASTDISDELVRLTLYHVVLVEVAGGV